MIKQVFLIFLIVFSYHQSSANNTADWGPTGHRTTGVIAEKHLTKKAKKHIDRSMLFYKFISYIFHPLLFSFIGSFLYLFLTPKHISKKQEYIILLVVFISTYILPLFFLLILKQFKLIKNYHLETINERKFPVIFFIVLSIMVGKMLMKTQIVDRSC